MTNHMTKVDLSSALRGLFNRYGGETELETRVLDTIGDFLVAQGLAEAPRPPLGDLRLNTANKSEVVRRLSELFDKQGFPPENKSGNLFDMKIQQDNGDISIRVDEDGHYSLSQAHHGTTVTLEEVLEYQGNLKAQRAIDTYLIAQREAKQQDAALYNFIMERIDPFLESGNFREAMLHVTTLKLINCDPTRRAVAKIFEKALSAGSSGYAQLLNIEIPAEQVDVGTIGGHHEPR